jgi:hypothetical protein
VSFSVSFVCIRVLNYSHRVATQLQLTKIYIMSYVTTRLISSFHSL